MDFEIFAALISFAALIAVWAFAPTRPATEEAAAPAPASSEVLA